MARLVRRSVQLRDALFTSRRLSVSATLPAAGDEPDFVIEEPLTCPGNGGVGDVHGGVAIADKTRGYLRLPDALECLAALAAEVNGQHAARLLGAAESIRQRRGEVRFKVFQLAYEHSVAGVREALGEEYFHAAWAEGAALSTGEAIAFAQRGRGERRRPTSGWESLTPTEHDVVRLVTEGLPNKDIAARLFISPRTVQSHLTHVYTKLGFTSRVQLVQEAARHT